MSAILFDRGEKKCIFKDKRLKSDDKAVLGEEYTFLKCNSEGCSEIQKENQEEWKQLANPSNQLFFCQNEEIEEEILKASQKYPMSRATSTWNFKETKYLDESKYELEIRILWFQSKSSTWGDVIHLYIKFLQGKIPGTPTHPFPLYEDATKTGGDKDLITINRLGFLTKDSQPGLNEDGEFQRQYLDGSFFKDDYNLLFDKLVEKGNNEIAIFVTESNNGKQLKKHIPEWTRKSTETDKNSYIINQRMKFQEYLGLHNLNGNEYYIPLTVGINKKPDGSKIYPNFEFNDSLIFTTNKALPPGFERDSPISSVIKSIERVIQKTQLDINFLKLDEWITQNTVHFTIIAKEYGKANFFNKILIESLKEVINESPNKGPYGLIS